MKMPTVAVLGPGAIGGFIASVLWKNGAKVTCISRTTDVQRVRNQGFVFKSAVFGECVAYPSVASALTEPVDILFVSVKAADLAEALMAIPRALVKRTVIVPLLNGFEHVAKIRNKLGNRVAVGMISAEVFRTSDGTVVHASPHAKIELASNDDISRQVLEGIAEFLTACGIETAVRDTEGDVIWRKLVRLNAIALVTAVSQKLVGEVRIDPKWRKILEECVHEAAVVAAEDNVVIDQQQVMAQIDALPSNLTTSLARDVANKKASEVDDIAGAIVRKGALAGISCPTIQQLINAVNEKYYKYIWTEQTVTG